jgi:O-methyltransferase involved in polyketide biosynthesis
VYISVDLRTGDLGKKLLEVGYDRSLKTIFLMEGHQYYLSPDMVDEILILIVKNSGKGNRVLFDYFYPSITEGTSEAGRFLNISLEKNLGGF